MEEKLQNIGLSNAESRVYLATLELGEAIPKHIAEKANIKRPTLYELLPKLLEKGLLEETVIGKRKHYRPADLQPYINKHQENLEKAQELVPQLRALLETASSKPRILFYEGVEGIKKVYYDHLVHREEILELVGIENIHPELQKYIINYYIPERTRRKIPLKMLVNGPTAVDPFDVKNNTYESREVRTIDKKILDTPLGLNIYGDSVSITLHRKNSEMVGLIIRSKEIAQAMRSIFSFLWLSAKPLTTKKRM